MQARIIAISTWIVTLPISFATFQSILTELIPITTEIDPITVKIDPNTTEIGPIT